MPIKVENKSCTECSGRSSSMFCSLKSTELTDVSLDKTSNIYKKGQVIFTEGHLAQNVFCITSGKVKIFKTGTDGKEQIVGFAKEADLIGHEGILLERNYFVSAIALEETIVCAIPKHSIDKLLESNNGFSADIIKMLTKGLTISQQSVLDMAQKSARERTAGALLMLLDMYGTHVITKTINTNLTRVEIASIAGTSTESCIRIPQGKFS